MESPVTTIKNSLSVGRIVSFLAISLVVFAILDLLNVTNWILYPVSSAKAAYNRTRPA